MFSEAPAPQVRPLGILLIASLCGAVVDWRYKRKGGKRSTAKQRIMFLSIIGAVALLFVALLALGADHYVIGETIVDVVILLFGLWEALRWRVRRHNPLQQPKPVPVDQNPSR